MVAAWACVVVAEAIVEAGAFVVGGMVVVTRAFVVVGSGALAVLESISSM